MDPLLLSSSSSSSSSSSVPKRPCPRDPLAAGGPRVPSDLAAMDCLLEAFLSLSDPSLALDLSLDRLIGSRVLESDKDRAIEGAIRVGSALLEAAKRSARKRAINHNSASWPLPADLTIKVFSMLDTWSLCHAAAACSMFNKCATDPLCYANIDLTAALPKANNMVVSTMIQRAGKNLQSLKLGVRPSPTSTAEFSQPMSTSTKHSIDTFGLPWNEKRPRPRRESSVLTRSCLLALSVDGGASGALLRRLHLYNIDKMDNSALCTALVACQSLLDLELIGLHVELRRTLDVVSTHCHSIERLFFESSDTGRDDSLKSPTCIGLVNGCPNLTTLALRGFKLHDHKVRILLKGFRSLKFVDFSTSYSITGMFLRNLGNGTNPLALEVLILRDCLHLKEVEVSRFLSAVLDGDFKTLRYLDISNKDGLSANNDWNYRCYNPSAIPISRVLKERPDICLMANFPPEGSFIDIEHFSDSEISSSTSFQMMAAAVFGSYSTSSSDSSYSSDPGSGNEDVHDVNFAFYGADSYDEMEFQLA
ncbi:F-box protein SKIP17 [Elaeis guineensis]|uniref:F-box protein SKIP17 n=1 Tax=Elaeis guineensis var. tenera TaxID=51953 RepID=UPI003C6CD104